MSYLQSLPRDLQRLLARGGTTNNGQHRPPLDADQAEELARLALTAGIAPRGPVLAYVVRRLYWRATGLGDRPTPPGLRHGERDYVDRRVQELEGRIGDLVDAPLEHPGRVTINPDGYTPPDNVLDLTAERERRRP